MASVKKEIFISSRFEEFKDIRSRLRDKINDYDFLEAIDLNNNQSTHRSPLEESLYCVRKSEVMILLLGETYGTIPKNQKYSYTHLEYKEALKPSSNTKILVFCIGKSYFGLDIKYSSNLDMMNWQQELEHNHRLSKFSDEEDKNNIVDKIMTSALSFIYSTISENSTYNKSYEKKIDNENHKSESMDIELKKIREDTSHKFHTIKQKYQNSFNGIVSALMHKNIKNLKSDEESIFALYLLKEFSDEIKLNNKKKKYKHNLQFLESLAAISKDEKFRIIRNRYSSIEQVVHFLKHKRILGLYKNEEKDFINYLLTEYNKNSTLPNSKKKKNKLLKKSLEDLLSDDLKPTSDTRSSSVPKNIHTISENMLRKEKNSDYFNLYTAYGYKIEFIVRALKADKLSNFNIDEVKLAEKLLIIYNKDSTIKNSASEIKFLKSVVNKHIKNEVQEKTLKSGIVNRFLSFFEDKK